MGERFDSLAKSVSGATSRREAFWRVGSGLALSVLAFLGLGAGDPGDCARCCVTQCRNFNGGHDLAVCITHCRETGEVLNPEGVVVSTICRDVFCS